MGTLAATAYQTGQTAGMVTLAVLFLALMRRLVRPNRSAQARWTDGIAVLVVAGLLIGNTVRMSGGDDSGSDPWRSGQGAQMKAGFIDGCQATSATFVDCGCAFEHLTSSPPYDTPSGLATLVGPVRVAQQTGNPRDIPDVLVSAMQSCLLSEPSAAS
jgi:hypothetical protein